MGLPFYLGLCLDIREQSVRFFVTVLILLLRAAAEFRIVKD